MKYLKQSLVIIILFLGFSFVCVATLNYTWTETGADGTLENTILGESQEGSTLTTSLWTKVINNIQLNRDEVVSVKNEMETLKKPKKGFFKNNITIYEDNEIIENNNIKVSCEDYIAGKCDKGGELYNKGLIYDFSDIIPSNANVVWITARGNGSYFSDYNYSYAFYANGLDCLSTFNDEVNYNLIKNCIYKKNNAFVTSRPGTPWVIGEGDNFDPRWFDSTNTFPILLNDDKKAIFWARDNGDGTYAISTSIYLIGYEFIEIIE